MPPPELTLVKQFSTLDKIVLLEPIDINLLNALINSVHLKEKFDSDNYSQQLASFLYLNEKQQLEKFGGLYDKKLGACKVQYNKPRHKYGRVFPQKSLGLTSLSKKIRNTLIKDIAYDIDLSNAQPAIIWNICKNNEISCPCTNKYINDRETILIEVMTDYGVNRSVAKELFIRLAFFGTFYGWCKDNGLNLELQPNQFITDFKAELLIIAEVVKKANEEMYETCRKMKENKNQKNFIGSFFSLYLQEYETRILESIIQWLSLIHI